MGKEQELLEAARTGNVAVVEKLLSGKRGLLGSGSGSIPLPNLLRYVLNSPWTILAFESKREILPSYVDIISLQQSFKSKNVPYFDVQ